MTLRLAGTLPQVAAGAWKTPTFHHWVIRRFCAWGDGNSGYQVTDRRASTLYCTSSYTVCLRNRGVWFATGSCFTLHLMCIHYYPFKGSLNRILSANSRNTFSRLPSSQSFRTSELTLNSPFALGSIARRMRRSIAP